MRRGLTGARPRRRPLFVARMCAAQQTLTEFSSSLSCTTVCALEGRARKSDKREYKAPKTSNFTSRPLVLVLVSRPRLPSSRALVLLSLVLCISRPLVPRPLAPRPLAPRSPPPARQPAAGCVNGRLRRRRPPQPSMCKSVGAHRARGRLVCAECCARARAEGDAKDQPRERAPFSSMTPRLEEDVVRRDGHT